MNRGCWVWCIQNLLKLTYTNTCTFELWIKLVSSYYCQGRFHGSLQTYSTNLLLLCLKTHIHASTLKLISHKSLTWYWRQIRSVIEYWKWSTGFPIFLVSISFTWLHLCLQLDGSKLSPIDCGSYLSLFGTIPIKLIFVLESHYCRYTVKLQIHYNKTKSVSKIY